MCQRVKLIFSIWLVFYGCRSSFKSREYALKFVFSLLSSTLIAPIGRSRKRASRAHGVCSRGWAMRNLPACNSHSLATITECASQLLSTFALTSASVAETAANGNKTVKALDWSGYVIKNRESPNRSSNSEYLNIETSIWQLCRVLHACIYIKERGGGCL